MQVSAGIKATLNAVGFYHRRLQDDPFPGVAVLAYHGVRADGTSASSMQGGDLHVTAARFADHCRVLTDLCTPISGARFRAISTGAAMAPPRAVLVTFDDGYASVLTRALPVLERYGLPAVVFACPAPIERRERFWFDAVAERHGAAAVEGLKTMSYSRWLEAAEAAAMPVTPGDPHAPLTVSELQHLAAHPLIEIGAHTMTHPLLARAPLDVQLREMSESRSTLQAWLGHAPAMFAYPNGRPEVDYTIETVGGAAALFDDAFGVGQTFTDPASMRHNQRRLLMFDSITGAALAHCLAVSWPRLARTSGSSSTETPSSTMPPSETLLPGPPPA